MADQRTTDGLEDCSQPSSDTEVLKHRSYPALSLTLALEQHPSPVSILSGEIIMKQNLHFRDVKGNVQVILEHFICHYFTND